MIKPPLKKTKEKAKGYHRLYKHLIVLKYFIRRIFFAFAVLFIVKRK